MENQEIVPKERQNHSTFKNDTILLGNCTESFIQNFYPAYNRSLNEISNLKKENSIDLLNSFTFYRLSECTVDNIDDLFSFFAAKMQKLFTTAYSIKQSVCYGIVSNAGTTSLVIGISLPSSNAAIKRIIEGLLPGMKIEDYHDQFENTSEVFEKTGEHYDKDRFLGCISGVPLLKINGELQRKDLSSLMRSLNGENYTIMVLCKPINETEIQKKIDTAISIQDECFAISKRTISLQKGFSNSNTHSDIYNTSLGTQKNKTSGMNITGTIPAIATGALIGSVLPGVGNVVGVVGGGLVGLIVGKQLSFNKSKTKGTTATTSEGYSDAITNTINSSKSLSGDIQNGFALELMKMAETMSERLKIGRNIGMWESLVTYSSDNEVASKIIQGSLYSEIASVSPDILPPIAFSYKDSCLDCNNYLKKNNAQHLFIPKDFFDQDINADLYSLVTSEELCGICTIPIDNTIGFELKKSKSYSLNAPCADSSDILLGNICEYEKPIPTISWGLNENDLNKHTFVCGITGSGKTNTVKRILEEIQKPFLVIEPAKKEYRNLNKKVSIYTLGRPEINSIKLNPFYILPGISPQQHIDLLKDLFCASFALYGPMPYILEKCLYNIYAKKGWNLTLGFHPCLAGSNGKTNLFNQNIIMEKYSKSAHKYLFPTMQDLKDEVDNFIENEMSYEGEVKGNIRSAIKARIDSLCVGSKGFIFNTYDKTNFDELFNGNTVLELEGLADDADKAFSLGLLIIFVNEYRQIKKEVSNVKGLEHLLIIEEAHRLLKNIPTESNEDIGNPKGKAVEHFTNMLAEMRSYGQGVIVVEQIPSKLAPDIIKNSSNKIVHRIVASDDQNVISNTIGVSTENAIYLGNQKTGYALCHKEGMNQPVIVKMKEVSSQNILDTRLYLQDLDRKLFEINKSCISNHLSKDVSIWAVKTLISLMCILDYNKIYDGLEEACDDLCKEIMRRSLTLIPGINKRKCCISCIVDSVVSLLVSGVFSNHEIPSNEMINLIENTIKVPTVEKIKLLNNYFEQFYKKNPRTKAIEIIAALIFAEYVNGCNIDKLITDFMLYNDNLLVTDVKSKLQKEATCQQKV